ncbi:uncharacterized protein CLAFUR5_09999 [Fulvia fulva]|uniref:Uncharacterized protein n=1 Tax=Passalora fulva TaxID=5499 RepID=A0A9Q8URG9_PASFU|nr:uncharacterized protein CLAFUR5_09999 [Fulvia fulva]UJO19707.1 hypothetical protein CLAFUR5_09999 [Fulvia fulva]
MYFTSFVLFATCAAAGVAGGRKPELRPLWSGPRPSREQVEEAFKYHDHAARHADAAQRPGWNRRGHLTKQALENVKYYADRVARDATAALSAGAPFKADPTETEDYWRSRETPLDTEAWPSVTEVLGQAVSGLQGRWASVTEAVQMRASDAVERAQAQAEEVKREAEAWGPAKRVKVNHPRELVYDRYDDLVEDVEGNYERDLDDRELVYDRYDNLVEDVEGHYERDLDGEEEDADPDDLEPEDPFLESRFNDVDRLEAEEDAQEDGELDNDDIDSDIEGEDDAVDEDENEDEDETPATTQPDPAQPQPSRVKTGHGHGHGHAHLHR